jgi:CxxC motif-containing protein
MYRLPERLQTPNRRRRNVHNAKCPRGVTFATEETTCPKRTVCSTVATVFPDFPVLPVRTSAEIKKSEIPACMRAVNAVTLDRRVGRGEVVLKNILGSGWT